MEIVELVAGIREQSGKNKAKQLRYDGKLPANFYGQNAEAVSLTVDARELKGALNTEAGSNVFLKLKIDGRESPLVMVREIQRHPLKDEILHVDFLSVSMDQKIVAAVPINLIGDSIGVREGGILQHGVWEISVEALPMDLPDRIDVDVADLKVGDALHAGDLGLSAKLTLTGSPDEMIVSVLPPSKVSVEAPVEEAAAPVVEGEETSAVSEES